MVQSAQATPDFEAVIMSTESQVQEIQLEPEKENATYCPRCGVTPMLSLHKQSLPTIRLGRERSLVHFDYFTRLHLHTLQY